MADYFSEMGWAPLGEGEAPNHLLHLARLFRDYNMFEELNVLNGERLPPPASKTVVETLPNEQVSELGSQCPICLKDHVIGEIAKKLPCKHLYHNDCIMPWLSKTNSCPLCRYELPTDDEDYEAWRKEKKRAKEREADIENLHNSMFS
ncbi:E3 ubiquitin-protein ligase RNF181 [Anoplophora glabripennis]|uniref:E3 ubiquitin-protein ligase RNF181 n=1 Tax=Anoplophora glabripennis TaxID=217634 RepID=UPI000873D106|nr:E3 ubiquitin-protein ligase RNF181 [Anoplophora glabripennis]